MNILVHSCSFRINIDTGKLYDWYCAAPEFDEDNHHNVKPTNSDVKHCLKKTLVERKSISDNFTKNMPTSLFQSTYKDYNDCNSHSIPFMYCTLESKIYSSTAQKSVIAKQMGFANITMLEIKIINSITKSFHDYIQKKSLDIQEGMMCMQNFKLHKLKYKIN
jgi:hypothetical protein